MRRAGLPLPPQTLSPQDTARLLARPTFENALAAAVESAAEGEAEAAKTKFEEALKLASPLNSAEAWHRICLEGGRWQQAAVALPACKNAIELDPENSRYYLSRAFVRQQLGDMAGAREDLSIFEHGAWDK